MTPRELRRLLDEERHGDLLDVQRDGERLQIKAAELTLADRLDEDEDRHRLFGGLL